ncbi:MAG: hypothetical protein RR635_01800 [Oscillospiraceae bacterium]
MITLQEREHLRALAHKQMEIAHSAKNLDRVKEWKLHNELLGTRPMIHIELDTFEAEALETRLVCKDDMARRLERDLYRSFINITEFDDDWVVPDYFNIELSTYFHLFGHEASQINAQDLNGNSLGHQFNYIINDLEADVGVLGKSEFGVNKADTDEYCKVAQDVFGDILPTRITMGCLGAVPTQQVIHMMGMETMCFSICDYPELFSNMMSRIADDYLAYFKFLQDGGYLLPTTGFERLNQGTKCFTDELASEGVLTTKDVWGFMDSQESVSLSPDMFGEFIFPCYKKIGAAFGLLSYGCCEPVDKVWQYVKTFDNLRKVSISPWCDEAFMADKLRGSKIIYQRKPSPNYLGIGKALDEDAFRAHIGATIKTAHGCTLEITQRDVYTIANDISKVHRYVQIIREEITNHW